MSSPSIPEPINTSPTSDDEPSSLARLPPSPPLSPKTSLSPLSPVDRLIATLRLRKAGRIGGAEGDWRVFKLTGAEHVELERRVEEDEALCAWYEDRVRYDWEPAEDERIAGRYTLRMPTSLHERFTADVEDEIVNATRAWADRLAGSGSEGGEKIAEELRKMRKGRSTTLEMHPPKLDNSSQENVSAEHEMVPVVKRSPDATFYHPAQPDWPSLVVEVSYNQHRRNLPRLAESYIIDSEHSIRCIVGLDIPYEKKKPGRKRTKARDLSATLSVWRARLERGDDGEEVGICAVDVDALPFRDASGAACDGALLLHLSDLLPLTVLDGCEMPIAHRNISIQFADLTRYLADAEIHREPTISSTSALAPKKFRKRKRTPSEELSDNAEAKYLRQVEAELEKERGVDGEWRARSRRRVGVQHEAVDVVTERKKCLRRRSHGRAVGSAS